MDFSGAGRRSCAQLLANSIASSVVFAVSAFVMPFVIAKDREQDFDVNNPMVTMGLGAGILGLFVPLTDKLIKIIFEGIPCHKVIHHGALLTLSAGVYICGAAVGATILHAQDKAKHVEAGVTSSLVVVGSAALFSMMQYALAKLEVGVQAPVQSRTMFALARSESPSGATPQILTRPHSLTDLTSARRSPPPLGGAPSP
jgi:hypothetical protein